MGSIAMRDRELASDYFEVLTSSTALLDRHHEPTIWSSSRQKALWLLLLHSLLWSKVAAKHSRFRPSKQSWFGIGPSLVIFEVVARIHQRVLEKARSMTTYQGFELRFVYSESQAMFDSFLVWIGHDRAYPWHSKGRCHLSQTNVARVPGHANASSDISPPPEDGLLFGLLRYLLDQ